jgi:hypothetical protein
MLETRSQDRGFETRLMDVFSRVRSQRSRVDRAKLRVRSREATPRLTVQEQTTPTRRFRWLSEVGPSNK